MSRDKQRLADYLAHILEAIERIDRYTEDMGEVAYKFSRYGSGTHISFCRLRKTTLNYCRISNISFARLRLHFLIFPRHTVSLANS